MNGLPSDALFAADDYRDAGVPRSLRERFVVPPFSVLDTSQGYWQERKRQWLSLGIESEVGRDTSGSYGFEGEKRDETSLKMAAAGTMSVFDPVLCELVYRWWSPEGGTVLDPFAGGSVRGIVASATGRRYVGVELRAEQVSANRTQLERSHDLGFVRPPLPTWIEGDAQDAIPTQVDADLVFSCPPYGDLERYSYDPRDLSCMDRAHFVTAYSRIIARAVARLRRDRFAVFVVGNYRTSSGVLIDLAGDTVAAFADAGLEYYGDLAFVTSVGSGSLRAAASFAPGRKPTRRHQYVLVFVKGDWRKAAAAAEEFLPGRDEVPA